MKRALVLASLGLLTLGVACAPLPLPDAVRDLDRTARLPAIEEAARAAPIARSHAAALVREAHEALRSKDFAGAQLLGEQAKAAFEVLVAEARLVRAEERRQKSEAELAGEATRLAGMDAENQRISADIAAIEHRIEALETVTSSAREGAPQRSLPAERLRVFEAARFEARVLCVAAELLLASPPPPTSQGTLPSVTAAAARLTSLDRWRASPIEPEGLRDAQLSVAACRAALEATRQTFVPPDGAASGPLGGAPSPAENTALANELSALGFDVLEDERGVVVRRFGRPQSAAPLEGFRSELLVAALTKYERPALVLLRTREAGAVPKLTTAVGGAALALALKPFAVNRLQAQERLEVVFVTRPSFRGAE